VTADAARVRRRRRLRTRFKPRTRRITAAALLALLVLVEYAMSIAPVATELEPSIAAPVGTEIILSGAAAEGPMLAYSSHAGDTADIRFDKARLSNNTVQLLRALGLEVTPAEAQMSWITQTQTATRTVFEVTTVDSGAAPTRLALRARSGIGTGHAQLEIEPHGAPLQVMIGTPFAPEESAPSSKTLTIDDRKIRLPGAVPLKIIVGQRAGVRAQFARAGSPQAAEFVLGHLPLSASDEGGLNISSIGVRRSGTAIGGYDYFACAAAAGSMSWRGADQLTAGSCTPSDASLIATRLIATDAGLEVRLRGSGWAQRGGELVTTDILSRIADNKVLAGAALAINIALASWLMLELVAPMLGRVRGSWSGGIFISYRREDTAAQAGRLHDHLTQNFGTDRVFMDVDAIGPGEDFARKIGESLDVTDALLAIIGKRWLDAADDTGQRRLDDPRDFVRTEIGIALERGAVVIPVLVAGARMPREDELPPALATLARLNAIDISDSRFAADVRTLIDSLAQGRVKEPLEKGARQANGCSGIA
jgi:hypothetical protein